jgi:hypothetical protein
LENWQGPQKGTSRLTSAPIAFRLLLDTTSLFDCGGGVVAHLAGTGEEGRHVGRLEN